MYNGEGKYYRDDGTIYYEGQFKNDVFCGQGRIYYKNGTLSGQWENNVFQG
jgi:hypothetical protein